MKIGFIAVGDEILDGIVEETNASYAEKVLSSYGLKLWEKIEVRDDESAIEESLKFMLSFCDTVFVSGGLGPTEDDLTTAVVCKVLGKPLVFDERVWNHIKELAIKRGVDLKESHKKMAFIPEGAKVYINPAGYAPAYIVDYRSGKRVCVLPGVPKEFRELFNRIMADIAVVRSERIRVFKFFGVRESAVDEWARKIFSGYESVVWGTVIKDAEVWLNVKADDDRVFSEIYNSAKEMFGYSFYGVNDDSLEKLIGKLLMDKGLYISAAESATGGLVANLITNVSGSSSYFKGSAVCYLEEVKVSVLGVNPEIVKKYTVYSHEVACEMAYGARNLFKSDIAVSTTGIAGPTGGTSDNPVGVVYIGISTPDFTKSFKFKFNYDRLTNKMAFAKAALDVVRRYLLNDETVCSG